MISARCNASPIFNLVNQYKMRIPPIPFKVLIQPLQEGGEWIEAKVKPKQFDYFTYSYYVEGAGLKAEFNRAQMLHLLETGQYKLNSIDKPVKEVKEGERFELIYPNGSAADFIMIDKRQSICTAQVGTDLKVGATYKVRPSAFVTIKPQQ